MSKVLIAAAVVLSLTGCDQLTEPKPRPQAMTEDGKIITLGTYYGEMCLDGFVALTSTHQSWWKLDKETRQPIKCAPIGEKQ
ncbi:hypothetical protein [Achromobacter phage Motura]|uniref:Lipoprotein n=1 Tax=Achromobacter phage Motura TaxID=2591403 RepID=A0A514CSY7_9CAUD|nr:hypothetical protein H1O15_gp214 [Achromobacter phage Motura]QDH83574.1 hypothetical protein [Achromobacter phage Motura]